MPKKKKVAWFKPGKPLNWKASESSTQRRKAALASRNGKLLSAARALLALSNVTRDKDTSRKAKTDAQFFFAKYEREKSRLK